jgi:hypothetical protein
MQRRSTTPPSAANEPMPADISGQEVSVRVLVEHKSDLCGRCNSATKDVQSWLVPFFCTKQGRPLAPGLEALPEANEEVSEVS